jgi:hypothetical protein
MVEPDESGDVPRDILGDAGNGRIRVDREEKRHIRMTFHKTAKNRQIPGHDVSKTFTAMHRQNDPLHSSCRS